MQLMSIHDDNNVLIVSRDHDERKYLRIVTFMLSVKLIRESHVISILEQEAQVYRESHARLQEAHEARHVD